MKSLSESLFDVDLINKPINISVDDVMKIITDVFKKRESDALKSDWKFLCDDYVCVLSKHYQGCNIYFKIRGSKNKRLFQNDPRGSVELPELSCEGLDPIVNFTKSMSFSDYAPLHRYMRKVHPDIVDKILPLFSINTNNVGKFKKMLNKMIDRILTKNFDNVISTSISKRETVPGLVLDNLLKKLLD